jgi:hypothetical protein
LADLQSKILCDSCFPEFASVHPTVNHNNRCEGALRPLVLGRKNWLHLGSEQAGPKVAAIASIVETCRRMDINLRQYLNDVLPKLGDWPINRVAKLTPAAWKAAQPQKS